MTRFSVVLSLSIVGLVIAMVMAMPKLGLKVDSVNVGDKLRYLQAEQVKTALRDHVSQNFFQLNSKVIYQTLKKLPWVDKVSVDLQWLNQVNIHIVEQTPVAFWGQNALLNQRGELFYPTYLPDNLPKLPMLVATDDLVLKVLHNYRQLQHLFTRVNEQIEQLSWDKQQSITITLESGKIIRLGQVEQFAQCQRLIKIWSKLQQQQQLKTVDLRYEHGFAVMWQ